MSSWSSRAILVVAAAIAVSGPVVSQTIVPAPPGAAPSVDLQLILAVDVSRSMDLTEQRIQRDGYVSAFRSPEMFQSIRSGFHGRIAVAYMEWGNASNQQVRVPWTVIGMPEEIGAFADALSRVAIIVDPQIPTRPPQRTSIANALQFAHQYFRLSGVSSERRKIDVSGDGINNDGPSVAPVRDRIVRDGIAINGLPIIIRPTNLFSAGTGLGLDDYYKDCVSGGLGSFVVPVRTVGEFQSAIRRKLIMEIASIDAEIVPVAARTPLAKVDCAAADQLRFQRGGGQ